MEPNAKCRKCGAWYYLPNPPEDLGDLYCEKCNEEMEL